MMGGIVDDETFRKLELQYRRAVVKVFCPTRRIVGGSDPWSGFAVNGKPCIILTVSHPVKRFTDVVNVRKLFHLNFFGDDTNYEAVAVACDFGCDLLVLCCVKAPAAIPSFAFANLSATIRSSTTIFSIAHPELRAWSILRGTICCDPFEIGPKHEPYNENMTIFDHDAALYPGASGAPIINLKGEVMGMQLTQLTRKLRGLCLKRKTWKPDCDYDSVTMEDFNNFKWEIKEFSLLKCDLRQAVTVHYMVDSLREMLPREAHDAYITDPNVFLREAVSRNLRRRGFQSPRQGIQPTKPPQGSSSRKRPWEESMLQSITDGNPKILHRHVEAADIFLDYISKAKASSLKLSCNKQTGQSAEFRSVEFLSHTAANNISQSYNGALVPNTDQASGLNGSTLSTGERRQDVRVAKVVVDAKTGRPKGSGFVRFVDENEKSRVMTEMNGQYCSRPTGKGVATPKKPSTPQQQYSLRVGAAADCAFTGSHSDDDTSNRTVYVGGLDFDVGDEEVRHTFSQFGEVDSVKIPIGKGCAFVQFAERTSAENSINQLNGTFVGKQRVCLSWGRNPGNKQKGSGFVRFGDENEESRAMNEMNGQYCSRPMSSGVATPKKPSTPQQQYSLQVGAAANGAFTRGSQSDDDTCNTTVYVGGLDFDVGDEEVRHAFSQFGEVSVKIPIGKGRGFVQFVERSSAENSINQLNGTVVGKQTVHPAWGQNPGNKQAFSDELYLRNESQRVSGLPKSQMDIFGPVKAIGDELRLFHLELEADKEKTAAELHNQLDMIELHNQLDAIMYKAMATC